MGEVRTDRADSGGGAKPMTDYEFYKSIGICPICRKERHAPGRVQCMNCLDRSKIRETERIERMTEPQKEAMLRRAYEHRRILYAQRKATGKCVRCGKQAEYGHLCYECKIKRNIYEERRKEKLRTENYGKEKAYERREREGKCHFCEEPTLPGMNICARHMEIFSEHGKEMARKYKFTPRAEETMLARS